MLYKIENQCIKDCQILMITNVGKTSVKLKFEGLVSYKITSNRAKYK